jgi:hypothetical protein
MSPYPAHPAADPRPPHCGDPNLHAGAVLLALLVTTTLSVYKPRGYDPIRVA